MSAPKAPDGKPFPAPYVAVDSSEQCPWAFGFHPAPWRDSAPVHLYERSPVSLVNELLEGPWPTHRSNLQTGDYQLLDGYGNPLPEAVAPCIERKGANDLIGSLTAGHDRFVDGEMPRLAKFRVPLVICEAPIEWLLGGRSPVIAALFGLREWAGNLVFNWSKETAMRMGDHRACPLDGNGECEDDVRCVAELPESARGDFGDMHSELGRLDPMLSGLRLEREAHRSGHKVRAMLGTLLSIYTDHRVLPLALPDRRWAEYAAAWVLRRGWRRWLTEEWDAGRKESLEAVRAQRATWAEPWRPV